MEDPGKVGVINVDENDFLVSKPRKWHGIPKRYILVAVAFLGFANVYALRVNLSIAIKPMSKKYDYSSTEQGVILSSFFAGYIFTQVIGGYASSRFGGKWIFGLGIFGTGIFTIFTPLAADLSIYVVVLIRVLEGLGEGVTYPSMHAIFEKWAPPLERSRLTSITYSGAYVGTIIGLPAASSLSSSSFLGGWPSVFYVFGAVAVLWIFPWIFFISSDPSTHPTISEEEKNYIVQSIHEADNVKQITIYNSIDDEVHKQDEIQKPLWLQIFVCLPFWAILVNHFCANWAFYTLLTWSPTYFTDVLDFNLKDSGFISVLPYISLNTCWILSGLVADVFITRGVAVVIVRKFFQVTAFLFAGSCLIAVGYMTKVYAAIIMLCAASGFQGFVSAGFNVNHLDIAPSRAGILMGLTNTAATIPGIIAPTLTGVILGDNEHDVDRWRIVFFIAGGFYLFGLVFYAIFASGKKQIS
eukprot:TRINITY_DN11406_c0_g1_i2.p1 TRINITY_DN11406_c0_g1~~TRINITY_DN11406_c0_g1_i2.p1  ORF type:complete len:469 (+),score=63.68 TRINITY_DN11406_c0_g1_i2:1526-2932(+)